MCSTITNNNLLVGDRKNNGRKSHESMCKMKSKLLRFLFPPVMVVLCLLVMVLSGGCSKCDGPVKDSTDNIKEPPPTESSITPRKPASATLLFDASGSMAGYLNSGDPRFIGVISAFEFLPDNIKIRLFGEKEESPMDKEAFGKKLNNRSIKWSNESNLIAMVDSMVRHINGGDNVCFLITDGILSGSNSEINSSPEKRFNIIQREKLSNDLSAKLKEKKGTLSALIVRYTSLFNGRYSCYDNTPINLVKKNRPFYVIALGKWESLKYIEEELEKKKKTENTTTPYDDMVMIGDASSYQNFKLSPREGLRSAEKGKWKITAKSGKDEKGKVVFSANLDILPEYMQTEDYMKDNLELYVQKGKKSPVAADVEQLSVRDEGGSKMLIISIEESSLRHYNCLTFKLKYAFPKWIDELSDGDDKDILSNPSKLGKTFNLKYFVAGFKCLHEGEYINENTIEFN